MKSQPRFYVAPFTVRGSAVSFRAWIGLLSLFLVNAASPALAESQEDDTRSLGMKLAASKAAEVLIGKIETGRPAMAVTNCSKIILSNAGQHRDRKISEDLLRQSYRRLVEGDFQSELSALHKQFQSGGATNQWFTLDWLQAHMRQKYGSKLDQAVAANLARFYPGVFVGARRLAVEKQSRQIARNVYPEPEEIEAFEKAGWTAAALDPVKGRLKASAAQKLHGPMLQEVEQQVAELVNASFDFSRSQIVAQNKVATEFTPASGSITREQMETELRTAVGRVVEEFEATNAPGQKVYGVFRSIESKLRTRAATLEGDRFIGFLNQFEFKPDSEWLISSIKADLERHKRFLDSVNLLAENTGPQLLKNAVDAYSEKLPAGAQRDGFVIRLNAKFLQEAPAKSALRQATIRVLSGPLRSVVRREVAEKQVDRHFPTVASGAWDASDNVFHLNSGELPERSRDPGSVGKIKDCLELAGIRDAGKPFREAELLEETESRLMEKCQKLLDEAQAAWRGQLNLLQDQEPVIKSEIATNRSSRTLDQWVVYYQASIGTDWEAKRVALVWRDTPTNQLPPNVAVKYGPLFGHTKARIRQVVKDNFDLAVTAIEGKRRPEVSKPEEVGKLEEAPRREVSLSQAPAQPPNLTKTNPASHLAEPQPFRETNEREVPLSQALARRPIVTNTNTASRLAQLQPPRETNESGRAQSGGSPFGDGVAPPVGLPDPGGGYPGPDGESPGGRYSGVLPWSLLALLLFALLLRLLSGRSKIRVDRWLTRVMAFPLRTWSWLTRAVAVPLRTWSAGSRRSAGGLGSSISKPGFDTLETRAAASWQSAGGLGSSISKTAVDGLESRAAASWRSGGVLVIGNMALVPVQDARKVWPERFATNESHAPVETQV